MTRVTVLGQEAEKIPLEYEPGRVMVALNGVDGSVIYIGETVSYLDEPSWTFRSGRNWAASICRPATAEEEIEYWRKRALNAEDALANPELDF